MRLTHVHILNTGVHLLNTGVHLLNTGVHIFNTRFMVSIRTLVLSICTLLLNMYTLVLSVCTLVLNMCTPHMTHVLDTYTNVSNLAPRGFFVLYKDKRVSSSAIGHCLERLRLGLTLALIIGLEVGAKRAASPRDFNFSLAM